MEAHDSDPLVAAWVKDQHRAGLAELGTRARERLYLGLVRHLGQVPLVEATSEQINSFLDTRKVSPRTRSSYLSWLASFYRWAILNEHTEHDPTGKIPRPKRGQMVPRPLAGEDVALAIEKADGRMRAWLCLAAWQGLRCKEIAGLRRDDLYETSDPPVLIVAQGKGNKQRVVPLNADTLAVLRSAGLPRSGYLFPHTFEPSEPIRPWSITAKVGKFLRELGIDGSAHQLRHYFGTEVYRRTHDLRLVQELLGHASPTTTAGYTKLVPTAAADVVLGISRPVGAQTTRLF